MSHLHPLLLLLTLASCATSAAEPAPDLISAKSFLEQCSESAGWNFTYKDRVGSVLDRALVAPFDPAEVPEQEFEARLDRALAGTGLDASPIGSLETRTLLIERGV